MAVCLYIDLPSVLLKIYCCSISKENGRKSREIRQYRTLQTDKKMLRSMSLSSKYCFFPFTRRVTMQGGDSKSAELQGYICISCKHLKWAGLQSCSLRPLCFTEISQAELWCRRLWNYYNSHMMVNMLHISILIRGSWLYITEGCVVIKPTALVFSSASSRWRQKGMKG